MMIVRIYRVFLIGYKDLSDAIPQSALKVISIFFYFIVYNKNTEKKKKA